MAENLDLGPILARFGQNLVPKILCVAFIFTRCYILLQAIIVCDFKQN